MSTAGVGGAQRPYLPDVGPSGDAGEIHSIPDVLPLAKSRPALLPAEEEASLPPPEFARDPGLVLLGRLLGARLSTDNLAWRGDPVPVMRSLQKMLVAHSLTLPEERREPAMGAIRAVELAVRWRLRWIQMRRSEAERHVIEPPQDDHETQKTA